jgi:CarD family transcriptional regulator
MVLTSGSKIIYPSRGPCLVGQIVERIIDQRSMRFYQLFPLDEEGGDLFVPVEKVATVGVRRLLKAAEIPKLMAHVTSAAVVSQDYRQRNLHNLKLLASGSAFDLGEIIGSLTDFRAGKSLSTGERKTLDKAKKLLSREIAEVMGTTIEEALEQVEEALLQKANDRPETQSDGEPPGRTRSNREQK